MNEQLMQQPMRRRTFLTGVSGMLGAAAMRSLLGSDQARAGFAPRAALVPPRAKSCIFIFLAGGPSQVDLFDPKPGLKRYEGSLLPDSIIKNHRFAFVKPDGRILPSRYRFAPRGQSGIEISDLLPHISGVADELTVIRSLQTDTVNHLPGHLLMNTGHQLVGNPSVGSWLLYGLGAETRDLPGYVVLNSNQPGRGGVGNWSSGFLPSHYQGVSFLNQGDPVLHLNPPAGINPRVQRKSLQGLRELNDAQFGATGSKEIQTRVAAYEMAFRMQASTPELVDIASETEETLRDYGVDRRGRTFFPDFMREPSRDVARSFSKNCLLARRMVERGVRFVSVYHGDWDQHFSLHQDLQINCLGIDQPIAALIRDLKQRGLLDSTLVVGMGEFGRTSIAEGSKKDGRGHHPVAFSGLMAGGGVKAGSVYGQSDDLAWGVDSNPVHVHDLHATMLHLFGLNHEQLTYRFQGRDFRLTDVYGDIVRGLIA